jgi:hypothetical protein
MPIDVTFLRTDDIPVLCAEGAIEAARSGSDRAVTFSCAGSSASIAKQLICGGNAMLIFPPFHHWPDEAAIVGRLRVELPSGFTMVLSSYSIQVGNTSAMPQRLPQ